MKELIKKMLSKLGLLDISRKIYYKNIKKDSQGRKKTYLEENKYSIETLNISDLNRLTFFIRMQIHAIEKQLVKGNSNISVSQIDTLIKYTQSVIDLYSNDSKSADLIAETIGIINAVIDKNNLNTWEKYNDFISTRHSIREFEDKVVDFNTVQEIIEIAMRCPSSCNRQPWLVYYSENKDLGIYKPDPAVSKDIHNFLIVTVNNSLFSQNELFQSWINGGIFLNSIIMAIHARGMGACLFQEIKNSEHCKKIKRLADIPESQDIVALIGFGYLLDNYKIIDTHRKRVEDVLVKY